MQQELVDVMRIHATLDHTWMCKAEAKSAESNAWQSWTSLEAALRDISWLLSFANSNPIFLELSSISLFFAGLARGPPRASDVSLYNLVKDTTTGRSSAAKKMISYQNVKNGLNKLEKSTCGIVQTGNWMILNE